MKVVSLHFGLMASEKLEVVRKKMLYLGVVTMFFNPCFSFLFSLSYSQMISSEIFAHSLHNSLFNYKWMEKSQVKKNTENKTF